VDWRGKHELESVYPDGHITDDVYTRVRCVCGWQTFRNAASAALTALREHIDRDEPWPRGIKPTLHS
jgi:hypothetical protein